MRQIEGIRPSLLIGVLCAMVANLAAAADVGTLMRQGNGLYARGKYEEALGRYQMAAVLEPDASAIRFNTGNALYRLGRYPEAARELELALIDRKPLRRANALYNLGNVAYKAGQLDAAIQAYKQALLENPRDRQAKENLEFCLRKKQEQPPDSSQQNQQQQQQQQQPRPQPQPQQGMDRSQAERLVQAVENKEREQQREQQQRGGRRKVEKDW